MTKIAETQKRKKNIKSGSAASPDAAHGRTIVLYSSDMEFCISLAVFFEDRFNMITTTEAQSLFTIVEARRPDLVIVDDSKRKPGLAPTEQVVERLEMLQRKNRSMRMLLFRVSRSEDKQFETRLNETVDAILYKPFDIESVARTIEDLLNVEQVNM